MEQLSKNSIATLLDILNWMWGRLYNVKNLAKLVLSLFNSSSSVIRWLINLLNLRSLLSNSQLEDTSLRRRFEWFENLQFWWFTFEFLIFATWSEFSLIQFKTIANWGNKWWERYGIGFEIGFETSQSLWYWFKVARSLAEWEIVGQTAV